MSSAQKMIKSSSKGSQMSTDPLFRNSVAWDPQEGRLGRPPNPDSQGRDEVSLNYSISHMSRAHGSALIKNKSKPNRPETTGLEIKLGKLEGLLRRYRLELEDSNILYMYEEFSGLGNKSPQTQAADQFARGSGQDTLFLGMRSEDQKSESDIYDEYIPQQMIQATGVDSATKQQTIFRKSHQTVTKSENISRSSVSAGVGASPDNVDELEIKAAVDHTQHNNQLHQSQASSAGRSFQHPELGEGQAFGEDLFADEPGDDDDLGQDLLGRESFSNLISDNFDYQAQNRSDDDIRTSTAHRRFGD